MHSQNWSMFDMLLAKLAVAGSQLDCLEHPLALFATSAPAPSSIEAAKLATINRSASGSAVNVHKVQHDPCEHAREQAEQLPPSAVVYELALGLRDRGWKYSQVIANLGSIMHRAMGTPPDFSWPCLKSITELSGGRMLCVACGECSGLEVAAEVARVIAMAYHITIEPVLHEINGVHCLHLVITPALDSEA